MLLIVVYLFCYYTSVCLFEKPFFISGQTDQLQEKEDSALFFKYRAFIMAFSMIPSLFLGAYQLRMLQLVRKLRTDQIYFLFRHRQC